MQETKVTLQKRLVLEFCLPGYSGGGSTLALDPTSRPDAPNRFDERWRLEVDAAHALAARAVLLELVDAISNAINKGGL